MKYPVIYVKNLMGVHKHSSVSYALHLRIVSDEAEDEQRAAYQRKVLTQMYHMVENQFVVAQSKIVENDGDLFVLFTNTVSHKMVKCALDEAKRSNAKVIRCHTSSGNALNEILSQETGIES